MIGGRYKTMFLSVYNCSILLFCSYPPSSCQHDGIQVGQCSAVRCNARRLGPVQEFARSGPIVIGLAPFHQRMYGFHAVWLPKVCSHILRPIPRSTAPQRN